MKTIKLITKRLKLEFDKEELCRHEVSLEDLEKGLEEGEKLVQRPLMLKNIGDALIVTFQVDEKKTGLGFSSGKT